MDARDLARFRTRLQRRRRELVTRQHFTERGVQEIREGLTDPEYEEAAQADHVEYTLGQLSDSQRRELIMVDAALDRIDAGSFGECIECGNPISIERLEALPYALRCTECALRDEARLGIARPPPTL
jgi:DnaK suppressor protein